MPGGEDVGELALVDEDGGLAFAHDEFCAVFDLVFETREAVDEGVGGTVREFDDVYKFVPHCRPEGHRRSFVVCLLRWMRRTGGELRLWVQRGKPGFAR